QPCPTARIGQERLKALCNSPTCLAWQIVKEARADLCVHSFPVVLPFNRRQRNIDLVQWSDMDGMQTARQQRCELLPPRRPAQKAERLSGEWHAWRLPKPADKC